jgi:U5 small nuclear ribonucleoprotein component
VQTTHPNKWDLNKEIRYTDCRQDEQIRGISMKAKPLSLVLQNSKEKSYLFNFMDTPGHPNFSDEVSAAFRLVDGVVIVVDAVEGVMLNTEKIIRAAIKESLDIILCINKIDRLVLELKLPPNDAYHKLKYIIDDFNRVINTNLHYVRSEFKKKIFVSPDEGNVLFSSSLYGMMFTLESYAIKYNEVNKSTVDYKTFAKMLWGDIFFNTNTRKFVKKAPSNLNLQRSFVEFILEPLYKIMGYSVSEDKENLEPILAKIGIFLKNSDYKLDPKPLLKLICNKFYGHVHSLVDLLAEKVVNTEEGAKIKVILYLN